MQKVFFVVSVCAFLLCKAVSAQSLKRRATLGVRMSPVNQEFKKKYHYNSNFGVLLAGINPKGTIGKLGVEEGAVLQKINEHKVTSSKDVFSYLRRIKSGDKIAFTIFSKQQVKEYNTTAIGKPLEKHAKATVHYDMVSYRNNRLRSILYTPKMIDNPPVIFYLQGYTCQSIEYRNSSPVKKLINNWIDAGFAVYLVEKPGLGDSESKINCSEINFHQELEAFRYAYQSLYKEKKIDSESIFLFGHSMGGVIAPLLAKYKQPKGIMVFGTVGKSWYEYMKNVFREQQMLFSSKKLVEENLKYNIPFITDLMIHKKSNVEMIQTPLYSEYLKNNNLQKRLAEGYYQNRHYTFWQSLGAIDVPEAWSKIKTDVYVMHGEFDIQAIHKKYAQLIVDNVNSNGGKAVLKVIPKTDHLFLKFNSMEENVQMITNRREYTNHIRNNYYPLTAKLSIHWMKKLID